jgi:hypothetical protein
MTLNPKISGALVAVLVAVLVAFATPNSLMGNDSRKNHGLLKSKFKSG